MIAIPSQTNQILPVPLFDGFHVEAVHYPTGTLCVSSQVGCAIGCPFCASGSQGLFRNLSLEEMQQQVDLASSFGLQPQRITVSGIGEPLHNLRNLLPFISWCRERNLPVSVTTVGHPLDRLEVLLQAPHNGVMLSLHAGSEGLHRRLVPGGPAWEELWNLLREIWPRLSRRRKRKFGLNYLLLQGVNDSADELSRLVELLRPFDRLTLHLLECNRRPDHPWCSPGAEAFAAIYRLLRQNLGNVRRSNLWRRNPTGGCGTLFVRRLPSTLGKAPTLC